MSGASLENASDPGPDGAVVRDCDGPKSSDRHSLAIFGYTELSDCVLAAIKGD
jgi:hypothetical protein